MNKQEEAALKIAIVLGETIKELGQIPEGELYAYVMGYLTLEQFQTLLDVLLNTQMIERSNHLISWRG